MQNYELCLLLFLPYGSNYLALRLKLSSVSIFYNNCYCSSIPTEKSYSAKNVWKIPYMQVQLFGPVLHFYEFVW